MRVQNYRALQMLQNYADQRKLTITIERTSRGFWQGKMHRPGDEPWLDSTLINPRGYEMLADLTTVMHREAQKKAQRFWQEGDEKTGSPVESKPAPSP